MNAVTRHHRQKRNNFQTCILPTLLFLILFTSIFSSFILKDSIPFADLNSVATKPNSNAAVSPLDAKHLTMYGAHKVQDSLARLPKWLQDYVEWHGEQRKKPISECKFLIIYDINGGLSDRLRPLPYWLLLAKLTDRVLLIKWRRPHNLGEFLVPPPGGLDWSGFPDLEMKQFYTINLHGPVTTGLNRTGKLELSPVIDYKRYCGDALKTGLANCTITQLLPKMRKEGYKRFVTVNFPKPKQSVNEGNMLAQQFSYENEMPALTGHWGYPDMFGDIFRVMFEPVPALAYQINQTMALLGLREGEYISAHVRARYPAFESPMNKSKSYLVDKVGGHFEWEGDVREYMIKLSDNAINCAHLLSPDLPVFFVSDSHHLSNFWNSTEIKKIGDNVDVPVLAVNRSIEPPHIDRDDGWPGSKPYDFFTVFEDILIMGGSKCVAHGIGSFGSLGSALIGNKCRVIHRNPKGGSNMCPNQSSERTLIPTDPKVKNLMNIA